MKTFPIITSCVIKGWGTGGDGEKTSYVCVLSSNIWNQKLYLFLYCWFMFLAILGTGQMIYRLTTIIVKPYRYEIIQMHCMLSKVETLSFRNFQEKWEGAGKSFWSDYSDWLFNKFIVKNSNAVLREILREKIALKMIPSLETPSNAIELNPL